MKRMRWWGMTGLCSAVAFATVAFATVAGVFAQEMSVEESYLQRSSEMMIIRQQSRGDSREMKQQALENIAGAIERGNTGTDMVEVLEYMALEGIVNKTMIDGRVVNDFPDLRILAVRYLGEIGTAAAKNVLLRVANTEREPSVQAELMQSLAKIGVNENNDAVKAITAVVTRFSALYPDDRLAYFALDALEAFFNKEGGFQDTDTWLLINQIAFSPYYIKPVRDRANEVLATVRRGAAQSNSAN
jgi:hypothetical protein